MNDNLKTAYGIPAYTETISWWNHYVSMVGLSTVMLVRRKRLLLAALITFLPVVLPLIHAYLSTYAQPGGMFAELNRDIYLPSLSVILALFFASMLLGEDMESQTMTYYLTRPLPRSIWVLGKFTAYLIVAGGLIMVSQMFCFFANILLPDFEINRQTLTLLLHFNAVAFLAIMGNGAVAMFLGVVTNRPIILGAIILFGWQRLAKIIPGAIDFFTINKYIEMLSPQQLGAQQEITFQTIVGEIAKQTLYISATTALPILFGIVALFIVATIIIVRMRQFVITKAIGS